MADQPVNLNKFRKAKARAEKRAKGDANAVKFGRSKAAKDAERTRLDRETTRLDAHRRDDGHDG